LDWRSNKILGSRRQCLPELGQEAKEAIDTRGQSIQHTLTLTDHAKRAAHAKRKQASTVDTYCSKTANTRTQKSSPACKNAESLMESESQQAASVTTTKAQPPIHPNSTPYFPPVISQHALVV
jgi:hypothetical protein